MESLFEQNLSGVKTAKDKFNRFFKDDLYGKYDDDENIILSRGGWRDDVIQLPKFFRHCIEHTLRNHWVGYSHSLGHERVFDSLTDLVNINRSARYEQNEMALTLGNVATLGFVFRQLKETYGDAEVLTFAPYYPPIVRSVSHHFPRLHFQSALGTEDEILDGISRQVRARPDLKILFLSNCVGVEGRIFTRSFWQSICNLAEADDRTVVIDEGMWFDPPDYPEAIRSDRVIRVVTTSKKHGIPGMKTGFMLASEQFLKDYYEQASTGYGGPASIFFLLSEFLYRYEYAHATGDVESVGCLAERYGTPDAIVHDLYEDFVATVKANQATFESNRAVFLSWLKTNTDLFKSAHVFQGMNYLLEPATDVPAYDLFLGLLQQHKVSVLPSSCLGDGQDRMIRVTILERQADVRNGLARLSDHLS